MTDFTPDQPQLPSLAQNLVTSFAQKALTIAATGLTAHGLLAANDDSAFVQDGVGLAMFAVSIGWTVWREHHQHAKVAAAVSVAAATGVAPVAKS